MFGRRKDPIRPQAPMPISTMDSDGKRRIFGEKTFAGPHGNMLREMGFHPNDPRNIVPSEADFDAMIKESLARQEVRRQAIEADLLARFGHNAIRPFFVLSEPVYSGLLGNWLTRIMRLMPYDEWNLVYLPTDEATHRVMGGLPYHPLQSVGPIDELMVKQIGSYYEGFAKGQRDVQARVAEIGMEAAMPIVDKFVTYTDELPARIVAHVEKVKPMIIELIADVQQNHGARH